MAYLRKKTTPADTVLGIIYLVVVSLLIGSYFANIYKLTQLDFEPNYKAEAIRIIGIPVAPLGAIAGFVTFDEEEK